MYRNHRSAAILFAFLCASTVLAAPSSPADYSLMQGSARITTVSDTMLAVVVAPARDLSLRHVFRIGFEESVPAINATLRSVFVEFRGNEIVVMDADEQVFYRFLVRQEESARVRAPRGFKAVDYTGIGISHTILRVSVSSQPGAAPDLTSALPELIYIDPEDWGWGGTVSCSQGGPGSTSCSVEALGFSCSVSCSAGYYACCSVNTGCKCVRE